MKTSYIVCSFNFVVWTHKFDQTHGKWWQEEGKCYRFLSYCSKCGRVVWAVIPPSCVCCICLYLSYLSYLLYLFVILLKMWSICVGGCSTFLYLLTHYHCWCSAVKVTLTKTRFFLLHLYYKVSVIDMQFSMGNLWKRERLQFFAPFAFWSKPKCSLFMALV